MRSAFRGPAHQLAVRMRINNCIHGHNINNYGPSNLTSHAPCASNCACAEGLHFSAFHYRSNSIQNMYILDYNDNSTAQYMYKQAAIHTILSNRLYQIQYITPHDTARQYRTRIMDSDMASVLIRPLCIKHLVHKNVYCTSWSCLMYIVNPRRACAARVTVVVLCVCLSICLFVCQHLFSHYRLRGDL